MKRNSFKYVFYFNVFLFFAIVIALSVFRSDKGEEKDVPVTITTPLLYSETVSGDFCHNAKSAVIIDAKSGAVLFEKNAHTRLPMASTTKIMTALAVLENASPDTVIEIPKEAAGVEGSSIYLRAGETMTVKELLYGLLLESGNDAATALAIGVFGSVEGCCDYMNERCHNMGLVDTNFENPHGLDSENHYTTAYELALITKEAMKNSLFRQIVSTENYIVQGENPKYFSNHNRLLKTYEHAVGVKTGYTSKSGRCLVSAGTDGDEEYIAVTLNDPLDWQDHKDMHTYAFSNFDSIEIADKKTFYVYHGFDKYSPLENISLTVNGDKNFKIGYRLTKQDDGILKAEYFAENASLGSFGMVEDDYFTTIE